MAKKKQVKKSRTKRSSSTKTNLKDFLSELAVNPEKLGSFIHNPEKAMKAAELGEEDQAALKSGFAGMIYARLAGVPTEQAFGTKSKGPEIRIPHIYPNIWQHWPKIIFPVIHPGPYWPKIISQIQFPAPRQWEPASTGEWTQYSPAYPGFQDPYFSWLLQSLLWYLWWK